MLATSHHFCEGYITNPWHGVVLHQPDLYPQSSVESLYPLMTRLLLQMSNTLHCFHQYYLQCSVFFFPFLCFPCCLQLYRHFLHTCSHVFTLHSSASRPNSLGELKHFTLNFLDPILIFPQISLKSILKYSIFSPEMKS